MCRFFGLLFAAAYFSLALWLGGAAGLSATPDDGLRAAPLRSAAAAAPDRLSASLMVEPAGRFLAMTTPESTTAEPECRIAGGCVSGTEPVPGPVWLVVSLLVGLAGMGIWPRVNRAESLRRAAAEPVFFGVGSAVTWR